MHIRLHKLDQFQPRATLTELLAHPLVGFGLRQFCNEHEAALDAVEPFAVVHDGCNQFFVGLPRGGQVGRTWFATPLLVQQISAHIERPVLIAVRHKAQRDSGLGFGRQWPKQLRGVLAADRLLATEQADADFQFLGKASQICLAHAAQ